MKTIFALLVLALSPICHAQRQLWTWSPPATESGFYKAIHTASTDASGNTAVVIGECSRADPNTTRYLIVWIGSRGNIIHQTTVATDDDYPKVLGGSARENPWSIGTVSATLLTVSDGATLRVFKLAGRNVSLSSVPLISSGQQDLSDVIFSGSPPVFAGWLQRKAKYEGTYVMPGVGQGTIHDLTELSAWVPK